jgi:2-polyprenyl-3-methyl-5-hydroxy-6-metoxy-1,4-benzoquinol methylase
MHCPLCSSTNVTLKHPSSFKEIPSKYKITSGDIGTHSDIYVCERCGIGFVVDELLIKHLDFLYSSAPIDKEYQDNFDQRVINSLNLLSFIPQKSGIRYLLDVGCYTGSLLEAANSIGYRAYGIEPSKKAVELAKKDFSDSIAEGSYSLAPDIFSRQFDVITAVDVLEHLRDPIDFIVVMKKMLKRGGYFVLVMPDFGSLASRLLGRRWYGIQLTHLFYFNRRSLEILLGKYGFRVVRRGTYKRSFSIEYIIQRISGYIALFGILNSILPSYRKQKTVCVDFHDSMILVGQKI